MSHERWASFADLHGHHQHRPTVAEFYEFNKDFKPTTRIALGDIWNFACLRRKADADDLSEDPTSDFQSGCAFLERFAPTVFLWGNHDFRLKQALKSPSAPGTAKANAASWIEHAEKITPRCRHIDYNKRTGIFEYGDHRFLHGYGGGGASAGNRHAQAYGNCCIGHFHRDGTASIPRLDRAVCHMSGCGCSLDMDYNSTHIGTLGQSHGWLYGIKTKSGKVFVQHATRIDGKWIVPTDF